MTTRIVDTVAKSRRRGRCDVADLYHAFSQHERVLGAEMTHYLGYQKGQAPKLEADQERANHRNGTSKKTIVSEDGKLEIEVSRDRAGEFEPQFIRKGQRGSGGFDSKIIAMYAQGIG